MKPAEINAKLFGYTTVTRLSLDVNQEDWTTTLVLELARGERLNRLESIRVKFYHVSRLYLKTFGGGLTQFLHLQVKDVRDQQWDGVNYAISEDERDMISFMCNSFDV